jgi:SAM-dependent methyltransferase
MQPWLLNLIVCPECRQDLTAAPDRLSCANGHRFPVVNGVPRFVQHELNADQARTRDSFGYEWTRLYPQHGQTAHEFQAERDIFLEYTRTVPSDFRGKLVLDAGCGNGRYAKLANDWGARVVAIDISAAVEAAATNAASRPDIAVVQADFFKLPLREGIFDIVYSVGVLHHTPDALGAFKALQRVVKPGGFLSIFVHGQGNRVHHTVNKTLRAWTSKASYRTTWNFSLALTAAGKVLERIPFVGPMLYLMGRQIIFFSPDQHNNFDHYSAGFTSFHRKEEVRSWYDGWDDVAVRYQGVANESIYARGSRPVLSEPRRVEGPAAR